MHENRCIGLYRSVSDANVRKRAQDHGTPAGLNAAPAAHFTAPNEPTRFRDLRTLCLYRGFTVRSTSPSRRLVTHQPPVVWRSSGSRSPMETVSSIMTAPSTSPRT